MITISVGVAVVCGLLAYFNTKRAMKKSYNDGYQMGRIQALTEMAANPVLYKSTKET
jgi:hypothetical protein